MISERLLTLTTIFAIAVLVNYLWELAQAPLYVGLESYDRDLLWHCFVASLGDGLMVLIIYTSGWIVLGRRDWFIKPGTSGYFVMLIAGLILAVLVEWVAVHVLARWAYGEIMPVLPGVRIALVPIAQMLVLPPIVFRAVALMSRNRR